MTKKKFFIHILGARPNFIKASPLIQALEKNNMLHFNNLLYSWDKRINNEILIIEKLLKIKKN